MSETARLTFFVLIGLCSLVAAASIFAAQINYLRLCFCTKAGTLRGWGCLRVICLVIFPDQLTEEGLRIRNHFFRSFPIFCLAALLLFVIVSTWTLIQHAN
jgi:hypothetical protein